MATHIFTLRFRCNRFELPGCAGQFSRRECVERFNMQCACFGVGPRTSGGEAMYKATHSPIPQVWRNACMWQRPGCAGMPLVQRGRVEQFNFEGAAPHAAGLRCMLERAGARRLALPFHDQGAATGGRRAVRGMPRVKRERVERHANRR